MKKKLIILSLLAIFSLGAMAQENKDYYFAGTVYQHDKDGKETRLPYVPIALAKADAPGTVVAVQVTNFTGGFSFKGQAIDAHKDYIFTLFLPNDTAQFQFKGIAKITFNPGNITAHMRLDAHSDSYSVETVDLDKVNKEVAFVDFISKRFDLTFEDGAFYSKDDRGIIIMINGVFFSEDKIRQILSELPLEGIEKLDYVSYGNSNPYFAGLVDMTFIPQVPIPNKRTFKGKTTYSMKRIK